MKIATWNINSLRLRLPLLKELINETQADVICLQETKVPDPLFPFEDIIKLGYPHYYFKGMKSYNGVAIISKHELIHVADTPDWCGRLDCRHIAAQLKTASGPITIHNFYVPAGGDIPDAETNPKFAHKLAFIEEATAWFEKNQPKRSILVGDLNTAPLEHDVWSHKQLLKVVCHTPPETERHNQWEKQGFLDAMRLIYPEPQKLYTWWSYRNRDWKKSNRGRRLDHIWISNDLKENLQAIEILAHARDWAPPSDHVPVIAELTL
ncbi:exodeoxyribonuclease III [Aristophania vespae]|uniref:Exodeoxyribonuclease III n=1 Tax=Aristophania vespae TaxID=2697033 RepID=A0A6P1NA15_9PROT|nr:exodeoxyribonuclease III [Aristophania vespae]QHI95455.1 exodeoxyribonuclease III [Aristophania vespae]UMM64753.1 Exodeoxyribonuclease III [Aristophania vespae]